MFFLHKVSGVDINVNICALWISESKCRLFHVTQTARNYNSSFSL